MKRILVVDDSKIILEKFVFYLKSFGYEAITAGNGEEALIKIQKGNFDLILMDLIMPVMDGFEAIRRIREMKSLPFIPIVVISGLDTMDDIKKALELGANEYVVKPIDEVGFKTRILSMLQLKEFYEKIKESEMKYEMLLQALPDVVYKLDMEGKFVFISDSVKTLGYDPQDLIGRHFSEIIHPDFVPLVSRSNVLGKYAGKSTGKEHSPKLFDERRSINRATKDLEVQLVGKITTGEKDGSYGRTVLVTVAYGEVDSAGQYDPENNEIIATVGIIRDVTREALQAKSKDYFTFITSHELKSPLNKLLHPRLLLEDAIKKFPDIEEIVEARDSLTKTYSEFERIVSAATLLSSLPPLISRESLPSIGIHSLLLSCVNSSRLMLKKEGRTVSLAEDIAALPEDARIICEYGMVQRAINEILSNAIKYTPDGMAIKVIGRKENGWAVIEVKDDGIGLPENMREYIFKPYFSLENPLEHSTGQYKFKGGGIGLGLTIAHMILEYHGGRIEIASEGENKGTTATIYIPLEVNVG
jgi:signal transduction histidine kinase/FixJ family two-component response regulator